MGCRFFFDQVRAKVNDTFPNLSGDGGDAKAKRAAKATIDGYGWLNSLYGVAQDGIFTLPKETPLVSAQLANLYDVLTYLSWKSACGTYEKTLNDLHNKENK